MVYLKSLISMGLLSVTISLPLLAQGMEGKAPTRLHGEPEVYLLLPLAGDRVTVQYTPGSLDRAANFQSRFELATRAFENWLGQPMSIYAYVLSREEWEKSQYSLEFGLPLRAGRHGIAVPALGDDGTVALWQDLLGGLLPQVSGAPMRGTPQQASTMALADIFAQLLVSEILVDQAGLSGEEAWVRGLMTHVASLGLMRRFEPGRSSDLDAMYGVLAQRTALKGLSARDYHADLDLKEWLWFQAQFHAGARIIVAKEGKGAVKKMRKLRKKGDGVLRSDLLLRRYKPLEEWYRTQFSAVSRRAAMR